MGPADNARREIVHEKKAVPAFWDSLFLSIIQFSGRSFLLYYLLIINFRVSDNP